MSSGDPQPTTGRLGGPPVRPAHAPRRPRGAVLRPPRPASRSPLPQLSTKPPAAAPGSDADLAWTQRSWAVAIMLCAWLLPERAGHASCGSECRPLRILVLGANGFIG